MATSHGLPQQSCHVNPSERLSAEDLLIVDRCTAEWCFIDLTLAL